MSELQSQMSLLISWMQNIGKIPHWKELRILDTSRPDVRWNREAGGWQVAEEALVSPEAYEQHFHDLMQAGYSWINLSLYGLHGTTLIVGVELPQEAGKVTPGKTSVNFSGPPIRNEKRDWQLRLELDPDNTKR